MIRGIYHSAAGMVPRYFNLINISNNLANVTTDGFRADRRYFSTVLNNELVQPGRDGRATRMHELEEGLVTQFHQGNLKYIGNTNFFALNGPGFFELEDPETGDLYYTRNGRFRINDQQELTTIMGYTVLDENGSPVLVDGELLTVNESGEFYVDGQYRGKFSVVDFENPNGLMKKGNSLFENPDNMRTEPAEETYVLQGHLEESNVNSIQEMVLMIELNRNYESSQRALTTQDETLRKAVNEVSKY